VGKELKWKRLFVDTFGVLTDEKKKDDCVLSRGRTRRKQKKGKERMKRKKERERPLSSASRRYGSRAGGETMKREHMELPSFSIQRKKKPKLEERGEDGETATASRFTSKKKVGGGGGGKKPRPTADPISLRRDCGNWRRKKKKRKEVRRQSD